MKAPYPNSNYMKLLAGSRRALRLAVAIGNTNSVLLHLSCAGLTKRQVLQVLWYARDVGIRNIFALRGGSYLFCKETYSFEHKKLNTFLKLNIYTRCRQPTACAPSVARETICNGMLSELKYSNYDFIRLIYPIVLFFKLLGFLS
jgi:5,10-methylenetetrahydrofolate reductase